MDRLQKFFKGYVIGLVYGLIFFGLGTHFLFKKYLIPFLSHQKLNGIDYALVKRLPAKWIELTVDHPEHAKKKFLFWTTDGIPQRGVALKVFEKETLFNSIFPGYEKYRNVFAVWKKYFEYSFDQVTWVENIATEARFGSHTLLSSEGCEDIFREFSADILVFGNSEANNAIVPAQLAHDLLHANSFDYRPKILSCAAPNSTVHGMARRARQLSRYGKQAQWAIVGVSPINLISRAYYGLDHEIQGKIDYEQYTLKQFIRTGISDWLPPLHWSNIYSPNIKDLTLLLNRAKEQRQSISQRESLDQVLMLEGFRGLRIPAQMDLTHESLLKSFEYVSNRDSISMPYRKLDCDPNLDAENISKLVASFKKIAPNILFYLNPVIPILTDGMYKPSLKCIDLAIKSRQWNNTHFLIKKREDYELDYTHFIHQSELGNHLWVDLNHMNYFGGRKFTRQLARILNSNIQKTSQKPLYH